MCAPSDTNPTAVDMATQQLKPQFFVTRQNGAMVPLIAMDELPIHVQIHGVPRSLSAFDIAGMTGVGTVEARHQYYVVDSMNNTKPTLFDGMSKPNTTISTPVLQPTVLAPAPPSKTSHIDTKQTLDISSDSGLSAVTSVHDEIKSSRTTTPDMSASGSAPTNMKALAPVTAPALAWRNNTVGLSASIYAPKQHVPIDPAHPPVDPNPEIPPTGQKVYCSYWLKRGECDYAQQGCMYKHAMPLDLDVLGALGFRDLPDWYRKTYNCGSLRINGGRNGLSYGIIDGNLKAGNGPRTRVDAEASRRTIAAHINSMPLGRGGRARTNNNNQARVINQRLVLAPAPRAPAVMTEAQKAEEKERRDQRLTAAFDADMASTVGDDMMDAEMEKIREREQAGWEEEQGARQAAVDTEKNSDKSVSASGKEEKKAAVAGSGAEGKKKGRGRYGRRKVKDSE